MLLFKNLENELDENLEKIYENVPEIYKNNLKMHNKKRRTFIHLLRATLIKHMEICLFYFLVNIMCVCVCVFTASRLTATAKFIFSHPWLLFTFTFFLYFITKNYKLQAILQFVIFL